MPLNKSVFITRTISAIFFAIAMLVGLLWNQWAFLALIGLIHILCFKEYIQLINKMLPEQRLPSLLALPLIIMSTYAVLAYKLVSYKYLGKANVQLDMEHFINIQVGIGFLLLFLLATTSKKTSVLSFIGSAFGIIYITVPMILLSHMYSIDYRIPLALILMIWSNDTMAYIVGSFIGKTPFSPISPKKTWEGTLGGALLTLVAAAIVGYTSHQYRIIDWVALALCATIAGTLGDLVESKLKRLAGVKDSGNIMPGHGGALDRFDSLLVAIPFAYAYVVYAL